MSQYKLAAAPFCKGSSGDIYEATLGSRVFAMKVFDVSTPSKKYRFMNETEITALCSRKGSVEFIESFITENSGCMVMKKEGVDLYNFMKTAPRKVRLQKIKSIFQQICKCVQNVHALDVAHLDIKPENILLSKFGEILLCDYGCAELVTGKLSVVRGTHFYSAPEVKSGEYYDAKLADIWSLGVTLFVMLTHGFPIFENTPHAKEKYDKGELSFELLTKMDESEVEIEGCLDLLKKILCVNPNERSTLNEILNHPWLKSQHVKSNSAVHYSVNASLSKVDLLCFNQPKRKRSISLFSDTLRKLCKV